ncbi:MAG: VOC family protein [Pseudomonadota bacterium]
MQSSRRAPEDRPLATLDTLTLYVVDPEAQRRFYADVMGMSDLGDGRIGYGEPEMALRFLPARTPYAPLPTDLFWKIAISVPDIELACAQLETLGFSDLRPRQFKDVGYLAHLTDPEGFTIELIDHWFEGERPEPVRDDGRLGGGAHLNLLTLRTAEISIVEPEVIELGMKPLSVQPVAEHGFTLHFYAATAEVPPNPDLQAIENRSWVYRRPYTVLEFQHLPTLPSPTHRQDEAAGYGGLTFRAAHGDLVP